MRGEKEKGAESMCTRLPSSRYNEQMETIIECCKRFTLQSVNREEKKVLCGVTGATELSNVKKGDRKNVASGGDERRKKKKKRRKKRRRHA